MNFTASLVICSFSVLFMSVGADARPWKGHQGPGAFHGEYVSALKDLPAQGSVPNQNIPWGDSYWPKNRGGAAYRWRVHSTENAKHDLTPEEAQSMFFGIELPSKDDLLSMSYEQLANLSPAEKLDIFNGDFDYPLTKSYLGRKRASRKMKNSPYDLYWEGYCNAWAAVSLHYPEPRPVTANVTIKGQTIQIPFGSGDIKALMVASYAESLGSNPQMANFCKETFTFPATKVVNGKEVFAQYGETDGLLESQYPEYVRKFQEDVRRLGYNPVPEINVNDGNLVKKLQSKMNSDNCQDTNAGAFHILMANQLGLLHEGFVIDKTRDNEIWNQPVFKFKTEEVGSVALTANASEYAVRAVQMKTTLYYADDTDYGWTFWNPTLTNLFSTDNAFLAEFTRYGKMLVNSGDETEAPKYPAGVIDKAHYIYNLEIDRDGAIVGGEWVTFDRPDVAWLPRRFNFRGDFEAINSLYKPIQIPATAVLNFGD